MRGMRETNCTDLLGLAQPGQNNASKVLLALC